ncbi:hypothetical protein [Fructobacillus parabroussonetiae]|uniref:Cell division protein FtsL n=1 Tax=Fructobacillus parabroussonetiae TaxID=2713174 RepID=A0ABS5QXY5_9LACO|nr:hypothetical protein [Fructobacillus parabroussonetiae]MBS9337976.1 hypothetical protein [Fructobacillus parabroussonetiae]
MSILKQTNRSAFVLVEALLALTIVTLAILMEEETLRAHRFSIEREQRAFDKQMQEKEQALAEWQRVFQQAESSSSHDSVGLPHE